MEPNRLHVLRAADAGHNGAERVRDLHRERPDASRRAIDPEPSAPPAGDRGRGSPAPRSARRSGMAAASSKETLGGLETTADSDAHAYSASDPRHTPKNLVTALESGHSLTYRLDAPRHISARPRAWAGSGRGTVERLKACPSSKRQSSAFKAAARTLDQHLAVSRRRLLDVLETKASRDRRTGDRRWRFICAKSVTGWIASSRSAHRSRSDLAS